MKCSAAAGDGCSAERYAKGGGYAGFTCWEGLPNWGGVAEACVELELEKQPLLLLVHSGSCGLGYEILQNHVATFKAGGYRLRVKQQQIIYWLTTEQWRGQWLIGC